MNPKTTLVIACILTASALAGCTTTGEVKKAEGKAADLEDQLTAEQNETANLRVLIGSLDNESRSLQIQLNLSRNQTVEAQSLADSRNITINQMAVNLTLKQARINALENRSLVISWSQNMTEGRLYVLAIASDSHADWDEFVINQVGCKEGNNSPRLNGTGPKIGDGDAVVGNGSVKTGDYIQVYPASTGCRFTLAYDPKDQNLGKWHFV